MLFWFLLLSFGLIFCILPFALTLQVPLLFLFFLPIAFSIHQLHPIDLIPGQRVDSHPFLTINRNINPLGVTFNKAQVLSALQSYLKEELADFGDLAVVAVVVLVGGWVMLLLGGEELFVEF